MSAAEVSLSASAIAARRSWVSRVRGSEISAGSVEPPDGSGLPVLAEPGVFCTGAVATALLTSAGERGGGTGIGREALAGAKTARKARSAAEIRVSNGLSDCMTHYKGAFEYPARQEKSEKGPGRFRRGRVDESMVPSPLHWVACLSTLPGLFSAPLGRGAYWYYL